MSPKSRTLLPLTFLALQLMATEARSADNFIFCAADDFTNQVSYVTNVWTSDEDKTIDAEFTKKFEIYMKRLPSSAEAVASAACTDTNYKTEADAVYYLNARITNLRDAGRRIITVDFRGQIP